MYTHARRSSQDIATSCPASSVALIAFSLHGARPGWRTPHPKLQIIMPPDLGDLQPANFTSPSRSVTLQLLYTDLHPSTQLEKYVWF